MLSNDTVEPLSVSTSLVDPRPSRMARVPSVLPLETCTLFPAMLRVVVMSMSPVSTIEQTLDEGQLSMAVWNSALLDTLKCPETVGAMVTVGRDVGKAAAADREGQKLR